MKIVDERDYPYVPHIRIYPFLGQEGLPTHHGHIDVRKLDDSATPTILFNIQLGEMELDRLELYLQAIEQAKRFADVDLLTHPEKPLPIIPQDVIVKPKTLRMSDDASEE